MASLGATHLGARSTRTLGVRPFCIAEIVPSPVADSPVWDIMRVTLDHIHIFSTNLSITVAFFQRMFDATLVWDEDAAGVRTVRLRLGNAFVQVYEQPPKAPRGGAMHHIGIETDDLDELVARMKANGHVFRNVIREHPKFKYIMTAGPDDLLIELFQCHESQRWQLTL